MLSSESTEGDGPSESPADSTGVSVGPEVANVPFGGKNIWVDRGEWVLAFVAVPFMLIVCSIRFLFFHRQISFKQARLIRSVLIHDRVWQWWHVGFTPWFTINWMLMTFDEKKDALSVRIKSGKRALDAFSQVRQALVKDGDMRSLFDLWQEFRFRDEAAFNARDRQLFMSRMGSLFSGPARIFLEHAILLRLSDYLVFKYLCCKTCRFMDERIRRVGIVESNLVTYFIDHKAECCQRIQYFKPTILKMARQYVDNMISFCITHGLTAVAHQWAQVGKCIVHLQELEPTDDNEPLLREELDKFISFFEQASGPVYVKYQELDRAERERQQAIANAASTVDVTSAEGMEAVTRWPLLHRGQVHRFKFKWVEKSLTIIDTHHREADRSYVKFENIKAPQALDVIEQLMSAYLDGGGALILPLGKRGWQASCEGAAGEFVQRETETWQDARPSDQKEVKRNHNRDRRIILDGRPLRVK